MNLYRKEEQRGKGSEGRWQEQGKLTEQGPEPWEGDKQNRGEERETADALSVS